MPKKRRNSLAGMDPTILVGSTLEKHEFLTAFYLEQRLLYDTFLTSEQSARFLSMFVPDSDQRDDVLTTITKLEEAGCRRDVLMLLLFQLHRARTSPMEFPTKEEADSVCAEIKEFTDGILALRRLLESGELRKAGIKRPTRLMQRAATDTASLWTQLTLFVDVNRRMSEAGVPSWLGLLLLVEGENLLRMKIFQNETLEQLNTYMERLKTEWWKPRKDIEESYITAAISRYPALVRYPYLSSAHYEIIADLLYPFEKVTPDAVLIEKNLENFQQAHPVLNYFLETRVLKRLHSEGPLVRPDIPPRQSPPRVFENLLPKYFYDFY